MSRSPRRPCHPSRSRANWRWCNSDSIAGGVFWRRTVPERIYEGPRLGAAAILSNLDSSDIKSVPTCYADRESVDFSISEQFFAQHQASPDSHPSYRHEEPASPTTSITLLTGGLLVRIQPEEPIQISIHQRL